jgi:hypothetical protein
MNRNTLGHRQSIAVTLSLLLLSFAQSCLNAQAPPPDAYTPLDAMQLDQLVAPIALYPDALLAQVLAASTFAGQVNDADNWIHQNDGVPPGQLAPVVNRAPWDPSVKALTEFPTVLDNMSRNNAWTVALGNAYYNQPGDVMNAVQAMRYQAQQAGSLRGAPQEQVSYDGGLIVIEPVNPGIVYVPYYNPWVVYGASIPAWSGYYWSPRGAARLRPGIAIGFGAGIGIGLFAHYGWGYHAWAPNWRAGVVAYHRHTYIPRSTTVIDSGNFGLYNRGVFEHAGRGVPGGYHPPAMAQTAVYANSSAPSYHPGAEQTSLPQVITTHPGTGQTNHPAATTHHPATGQTYRPPAGASHSGTAPTNHAPNQSPDKPAPSGRDSKAQAQSTPKAASHGK